MENNTCLQLFLYMLEGTYQTQSIASENPLDTSLISNGTLNGTLNSASHYSSNSHQNQSSQQRDQRETISNNYFQNQHSNCQSQAQSQISAQLAQSAQASSKPPSSLTLYTYLLESNKAIGKDVSSAFPNLCLYK